MTANDSGEDKDDNLNEEGKTISYRFPRYEKKSWFTMLLAIILPSAIYAFKYFPMDQGRALDSGIHILTFFAYPWGVLLNTVAGIGIKLSMAVFVLLHLAVLVIIYRNRNWSPKKAFVIAISIGMFDLLLYKILGFYF